MKDILKNPINILANRNLKGTSIIDWASPIISFGNPSTSTLATLGLNPSNLEYLDRNDVELQGQFRRFHTLYSLGLKKWTETDADSLIRILDRNYNYFRNNPYDTWFKRLDYLISGSNHSYYFPFNNACHLDLVPYATFNKWGSLSSNQKSKLLEISINSLGHILNHSKVEVLILNGSSVISTFQVLTDSTFKKTNMPNWSLPRKGGNNVLGLASSGLIDKVGGIELNRKITVLGFNHNIQSSFGVTRRVQLEIRNWIKNELENEKV